jgi:hypothetical protein
MIFLTVEMVLQSMEMISTSIGAISIVRVAASKLVVVVSILCGASSIVVKMDPILVGVVFLIEKTASKLVGAVFTVVEMVSKLVGTALKLCGAIPSVDVVAPKVAGGGAHRVRCARARCCPRVSAAGIAPKSVGGILTKTGVPAALIGEKTTAVSGERTLCNPLRRKEA